MPNEQTAELALPQAVRDRPGHCRIIIDAVPGGGPWNMAVDEVLLESAWLHGVCSLRLYGWSAATISLGYFQRVDAATFSAELRDLSMVRRLSGGGAILHHNELTYSIALPSSHQLARVGHRLYELVHESIIAVLAERGIAAAVRGGATNVGRQVAVSGKEPFLCFGRKDSLDVLYQGQKVVGSAQRRRRGAVLQHGSVLLEASPHAPQFPGLCDLEPGFRGDSTLNIAMADSIGALLGPSSEPAVLSVEEIRRGEDLERDRYAKGSWKPGK